MFIKLILIFTLVPLLELALLIQVGNYVGLVPTIFLVASTGMVGIFLARNQGLAIINKVRSNLSQGKMPEDSLIDGLLVLIGSAMLLTPGLLTDITGFSLIIPISRGIVRNLVKKKFKGKIITSSHINFNNNQDYNMNRNPSKSDDFEEENIIDIDDYEEVNED